MGSFGTTEILLILIVGFILLGPKGLSKLAKTIGQIFGEMTRFREDVEKSIHEVKDTVDETVSDIKRGEPQHRTVTKKIGKNKTNNNQNTKGE